MVQLMNLVKLCCLIASLMEYLITEMSWQAMIYVWGCLAAYILLATGKLINLPFVSSMLTTLGNLLLFIFILFYLFMKIRGALNQQLGEPDSMVISRRYYFLLFIF